MHVNLGADSTRPIFEVIMPGEAVEEVQDRPGFNETLDAALELQDLRHSEVDKDMHFMFLLRRIGRAPVGQHEPRLRTVVKMFDWLSIADRSDRQAEFDTTQVQFEVDADRSINGSYLTKLKGTMPAERYSIRAARQAENVMHAFGRQLRYGTKADRETHGRSLAAHVQVVREGTFSGVSLLTSLGEHQSIGNDSVRFDKGDKFFELRPPLIRSRKQQVIYIAGAAAVAGFDRFTQ